jgi:hypothetical protein
VTATILQLRPSPATKVATDLDLVDRQQVRLSVFTALGELDPVVASVHRGV